MIPSIIRNWFIYLKKVRILFEKSKWFPTKMCNVLDVWKQKKTRNLEYVLFEGNTKHCNKIMGVLPQSRMSYVCVS